MVIVEKRKVANIPVLEIVSKNLFNEAVPTVFFFHGFTSAKEHNLHYAYLMAEKNLRVVLPDADFHGDRSKSVSGEELAFHFWEIILQNISELEQLKDEFVRSGRTLKEKIGVAGTSMGGITTFGALAKYDWITAGVSLMGNPAYEHFARHLVEGLREQGYQLPYTEDELEEEYKKLQPFDLSMQPEKLNRRPLMIWHGKKDTVVPYIDAYKFYERVKKNYHDIPDKIAFILDEKAGHKVSREGLLKTVGWFDKFLNG